MNRDSPNATLSEVEIRLLGPADSGMLARVDPDVFDQTPQPHLAAQFLAAPGNLLAVAIHAEQVIGMASAIAYVHPDKPLQLFINEVGVADRWQGRGIGKRLLSAMLERGKALGCVEAWVATEVGNAPARALYASMAGSEDAERAVVYTWSLAETPDT